MFFSRYIPPFIPSWINLFLTSMIIKHVLSHSEGLSIKDDLTLLGIEFVRTDSNNGDLLLT